MTYERAFLLALCLWLFGRGMGDAEKLVFFFLNNTAPPEFPPLPLHAPLPIWARPAQLMHAGVDDEARGPPRLRVQHPEALRLVSIQAHLVGEALGIQAPALDVRAAGVARGEDRKSTRLNSSHLVISYAVFCLK